jgi:hypothetical protein
MGRRAIPAILFLHRGMRKALADDRGVLREGGHQSHCACPGSLAILSCGIRGDLEPARIYPE